MAGTWKPAPEPRDATGTEWAAWLTGALAVLLLLIGTIRLVQVGDMPADLGVPYLGSALALMLLGVAATVVSAAAFVLAALERRS